ncbi:MAG: fumarylacetoacetase [Saprospiraceae bacterium]|nr:fumarylacetoacetase [Saprospiraceae bacterium]
MSECIFPISEDSDFSLANLPLGVFSESGGHPHIGIAVGSKVLDLSAIYDLAAWTLPLEVLQKSTLNAFIGLGKEITNGIRQDVREWLTDPNSIIANRPRSLIDQAKVAMHLPIDIGDYTDFYSSYEHAANVGRLYRDPGQAVLPNWKHLPVAYHGRASSIVLDGDPIYRPTGQYRDQHGKLVFAPTKQLDFELEAAFVIGRDSEQGHPISMQQAEDYIFGLVLFNDWSARDIQKWEYRPLGPFLGKSFASSMSPWIVPLEALEPCRLEGPLQNPAVLPYLQSDRAHHFDISLSAEVHLPDSGVHTLTKTNHKHLYWSMAQQLTHHTSNGCNVKIGDLMASGTISGREEGSWGSLLEMTSGGTRPIQLGNSTRDFLQDGDAISISGAASVGNCRIGFGSLVNQIVQAP